MNDKLAVQWVSETDENVPRGRPEVTGDGKDINSIRFRCHPDDVDEVMAKVKRVAKKMGGTNIQSGRAQ